MGLIENKPGFVDKEAEIYFFGQREKLNKKVKELALSYANARNPGDCYILDVILGIDPRNVVASSITPTGYQVFKTDNGDRIMKNGDIVKVTRKFTRQQKITVKVWWDLFSLDARGLME